MPIRGKARLGAVIVTLVWSCSLAAQSLNRDLTNPDEIAQQCGGSADVGAPLFAENCAACHALSAQDGQLRSGPHLADLYGRTAFSLPDFAYSPATQDYLAVWEGDTLHELLAGKLPMVSHPIISDEQMVRDILTFVRTETRPAPPEFADIAVPETLLTANGDTEYGAYLASDCVQCHNATASENGTPDITQLPRDTFLHLMLGYRVRALPNPVMQLQASQLGDEELAALAAYFTQQGESQ